MMTKTEMRHKISRGLLSLSLTIASFTSLDAQPINIGSQRELFVDKHLVETISDLELRLHEPTKTPRPESPLPVRHAVTVIKDGNRYRAYYRSGDPSYKGPFYSGHPGETVCYAESLDGHNWILPNLGLHEVGGTMENNAILTNMSPYLHNFMPFLDTRPGVDPAERYKAVTGYPGKGDKRGTTKEGIGLYGFVSPDGIEWTMQGEIIPYQPKWRHAFDSANVAFWSEAENQYVCYFRTWTPDTRIRTVARSTSPDFVEWSEPVEMNPNLPGEHLYTTMTHPYVRAPQIYIALPTRFVPGEKDSAYQVMENLTDVLFMSSRAGSTHYNRLFTEAFIRPGLDSKQWTNRANYVANNVLQTSPTELSIYHRSGDRYVIRTDGFISVHAGTKPGTLITKPVIYTGGNLELNYSTSAKGYVQVELIDAEDNVIARSQRIIGDAIDGPVRWSGRPDVAEFSGKPVRLRFSMEEADLYAYKFSK